MPKFTWRDITVGVGIVCLCCLCTPIAVLMEPPAYLLIGWIFHAYRLATETVIDWPNLAIAAGSLGWFTLGFHLFCKWFASTRNAQWRWRSTFGIVGLMMLAFLAGISAIGVTHQTMWMVTTKETLISSGFREASPRTRSTNNLKNLGIAAHGYHDAQKSFPAGGTFDAQGRGLHGWQTVLLPYLDHLHLHEKIDFSQPWNSPRNAEFSKLSISSYFHNVLIEEREIAGYSVSHFTGNSHVLGAKEMKLSDITDGTSNTLLMGAVTGEFKPWAMPMNCRDPAFGFGTTSGFADVQGKAVLFVMADGTVRAVRPGIEIDVLRALATPRGGDDVDMSAVE